MEVTIRAYQEKDIPSLTDLWNEIVEEGNAFPQEHPMTREEAVDFFADQSFTGVASLQEEIVGLYILHPNNIGRCGHLANASYAVKSARRGLRIGEKLVRHSLRKTKELGFGVLQFNAVVATNHGALHLYEKLGFHRLGSIPKGFRLQDGRREDIVLFYHDLSGLEN